jgi:hypothetical protein
VFSREGQTEAYILIYVLIEDNKDEGIEAGSVGAAAAASEEIDVD